MQLRVLPDEVHGTLTQGWRRRARLASASQAVGASESSPAPQGPAALAWSAQHAVAVDAVLRELGAAAPLRGARLDVEIDNALVLFDVARGDFAGDSDRQLRTVAVACMSELLGDSALDQEVRCELQAGGRHLMICAMPSDQIGMLADRAASHGLRLRSVQPDFILQWNRHGTALTSGDSVFAVAQGQEAMVSCVSGGAIVEFSRGGWLDQQQAPDDPPSRSDQLMSDFGLEAHAAARALDVRVDRLLASVGQVAVGQSAYLLVAPPLADDSVSQRWTVVTREVHAP